jgi:FkbM family methyltransferase
MRQTLKKIASSMHRVAATHGRLASPYLRLFRLAKYLPDARWKNFVMNSLQSVRWPVAELPPARIKVDANIAFRIVPHLDDWDFAAHLYQDIGYESEIVSWITNRQYELVIEIGANFGIYTILFSKIWPGARIYSFEPSRTAYRRLLQNLECNDCKNVCAVNSAVSSESGLVDFYEPQGHLANGSLDRNFAARFANYVAATKVVAINGCELKKLFHGGQRALIKIDVEGMEPAVLRMLQPILASERPDIVIEVLETVAGELNALEFLCTYRFLHLTPDGPAERQEFIAGEHRDYALIPR